MKLSTRSRYGLRAICALARHRSQGPMSLARIAELEDLSQRYLEQLFIELRKAGFVKSVRGVNGGYLLQGEPAEIKVGEILKTLDGDIAPIACGSQDCKESCAKPDNCITRPLWEELNQRVSELMDSTTIQDLIEGREI